MAVVYSTNHNILKEINKVRCATREKSEINLFALNHVYALQKTSVHGWSEVNVLQRNLCNMKRSADCLNYFLGVPLILMLMNRKCFCDRNFTTGVKQCHQIYSK